MRPTLLLITCLIFIQAISCVWVHYDNNTESYELLGPNYLQRWKHYVQKNVTNLKPYVQLNESFCDTSSLKENITTSEYALIIPYRSFKDCKQIQKIITASKLGFSAILIIFNSQKSLDVGENALIMLYDFPDVTNISIVAVEIHNASGWKKLEVTIQDYNDTRISIIGDDKNPYIEVFCGTGAVASRTIVCILIGLIIAYGIYNLIMIIKHKKAKLIPVMIIIIGIIGSIDIFLFLAIDPMKCDATFVYSLAYYFMVLNPIPLMIVMNVMVAIIWHEVMRKDFKMDKNKWVRRILSGFLGASIVIYPIVMVAFGFYIYGGSSAAQYIAIVLLVILMASTIIYYAVNLVRIINTMSSMNKFNQKFKQNHLDKVSIIALYFVAMVLIICLFAINSPMIKLIIFVYGLFIVNLNYLFCFYFLRIKEDISSSKSQTGTGTQVTDQKSKKDTEQELSNDESD